MPYNYSNYDVHDEIIELDDGTLIQHGKYNDRVYLMKISENPNEKLSEEIVNFALKNKYSKIFAKIPGARLADFENAGFAIEATVPLFYKQDDGYFMAYYFDAAREIESAKDQLSQIRDYSLGKSSDGFSKFDNSKYKIRICDERDVKTMAKLYETVFPSYPFPINKPEYLLETMKTHVEYYCVEDIENGEIVSLSSSEIDFKERNAEMTDFATHPQLTGNGFAAHLLSIMENNLIQKNIRTFYTIARALSYGMNITFAKTGYECAGRLKNNTNISGNIESMNVWYKTVNDK